MTSPSSNGDLREAVVIDGNNVTQAIERLGLDIDRLHHVTAVARHFRLSATALHAPTAAGTYAWHEGVHELRCQFVGEDWKAVDDGNVPYIQNVHTGVRVGIWNVDRACSKVKLPVKISKSGAQTNEVCDENAQVVFEFTGGRFRARETADRHLTYFLMNDLEGRAELSLVGEKGAFIERMFVLEEPDPVHIDPPPGTDSDDLDDLDVSIERR